MGTKTTLQYSHLNFPPDFPVIGYVDKHWILSDEESGYLHCHNCLEIGYCHKGNGSFLIENKNVRFSDEDIIVICPNTMHISKSDHDTSSEWEYIYIDVASLVQEYLTTEVDVLSIFMFDSPDFPNNLSGREFPVLKNLLFHIFSELREKKDQYQLNTALLCIVFLTELTRILPRKSSSSFCPIEARLAIYPALEYVAANYMNPIKMNLLADTCHLSPTHFRRLFRGLMQMSPLDYLNRIRVQKACELLYSTEESVLTIALAVGFTDNTAFNRNFRRIMGMTPLKWRKQSRSFKKNDMVFSIFPSPPWE